jgi:hypothetical protein
MASGLLDAVGIGYWAVTTGGGVGAGVGVPLVMGVPLPQAARTKSVENASVARANGNNLLSCGNVKRAMSRPPLLADPSRFPPTVSAAAARGRGF